MKRLIPFSFLLLSLGACSPPTEMYNYISEDNESWSFDWESKGCMGTCAIYRARMDGNILRFRGMRNTQFQGDTLIADQKAFNDSLAMQLQQLKFIGLDSLYQVDESADGPQYVYRFQYRGKDGNFDKKVRSIQNEPKELVELRRWLNKQLQKKGLL